MTFTFRAQNKSPAGPEKWPDALPFAKELLRALEGAAACACAAYGVPKIYFALALGKRFHYLTGHGEETYLPAVREPLGRGIWVFIEGAERLTAAQKEQLLATLRSLVGIHCTQGCGKVAAFQAIAGRREEVDR
ncbi:MAG: hypothetical protein ACUVRF_06045 [Desulfotomaculales bacterium]